MPRLLDLPDVKVTKRFKVKKNKKNKNEHTLSWCGHRIRSKIGNIKLYPSSRKGRGPLPLSKTANLTETSAQNCSVTLRLSLPPAVRSKDSHTWTRKHTPSHTGLCLTHFCIWVSPYREEHCSNLRWKQTAPLSSFFFPFYPSIHFSLFCSTRPSSILSIERPLCCHLVPLSLHFVGTGQSFGCIPR